jgi:hypothetical protein
MVTLICVPVGAGSTYPRTRSRNLGLPPVARCTIVNESSFAEPMKGGRVLSRGFRSSLNHCLTLRR